GQPACRNGGRDGTEKEEHNQRGDLLATEVEGLTQERGEGTHAVHREQDDKLRQTRQGEDYTTVTDVGHGLSTAVCHNFFPADTRCWHSPARWLLCAWACMMLGDTIALAPRRHMKMVSKFHSIFVTTQVG